MSEPVNPLFEEEKAFLERKKQEYERALRGDVAMLKEQAGHAGRIAAVGAGLAGSIWLITKAFGGKSRQPDHDEYDDYAYDPGDYPTQHFGDYDPDGEEPDQPSRWYAAADKRGQAHGTVYHSDTDRYDTPSAHANDDPDEDDGFGRAAEHFESEAYGHPESTLPFDDSRRLPESADFQEPDEETDNYERRIPSPPAEPQENLGAMLSRLARTSMGKMLVGQALSFGLGLAAKVVREKLERDSAETPKNSDLADETGATDGYAHGTPTTPPPDADHPSADAANF